jgi:hypothetical protein
LRTYARIVAVVLVLAPVADLFGWLALGQGSALLYIFTTGVFAYAGGHRRDAGLVRAVVGSFGGFYLASGLVLALVFVVLGGPLGGRRLRRGVRAGGCGRDECRVRAGVALR